MGRLLSTNNKNDTYDNREIINNISDVLNSITAAFTSSVIVNSSDKYKELHSILLDVSNLCDDFESIGFEDIPEVTLKDSIYPLLNNILVLFQELAQGPDSLNFHETRKQLYYRSLNLYAKAYNLLTPIITYHKMKYIRTDSTNIEQKFNQLYEKIQSEHEQFTTKGKEIEEKQKLLLEQSEKLTENLGISSYAKYFQDEAKNHNIKSQLWVIITFSIAVATILFAIGGHIYLPDIPGDTLTPKYVSQVLAPKATVLAILIYMLTWSVKNQKSHNHNYIVNNHRKNALETFQAFVLSSEGTPEIKHAMLMQMTNCIFNHQNSSYTVTEKEPDIANKLLDLVKPSAKGS